MPEMRLVVLAVQDRLAYGPTFESALAALFGQGPSTLSASTQPVAATQRASSSSEPTVSSGSAGGPRDVAALISEAARDLSDYQQLTAAGRLGEAGQKLEALKRTLEELQRRRP
jgi:uncharacterized protein